MHEKFKTVYIDPPWNQRGGGKIKRGADRHYKLMKEKEIEAVIRQQLDGRLNEHVHMYLWTANNHLPEALRIIENLGFRYITNIVWAKPRFGLGRYFRGQHEICLFATKGRGFAVRKDVNNISTLLGKSLINPTKHSTKPQEMYDLIESRSEGPYLELFARNTRSGWKSHGDEIE
jgi:N6-adenosine-specific RNA methylase IME4